MVLKAKKENWKPKKTQSLKEALSLLKIKFLKVK